MTRATNVFLSFCVGPCEPDLIGAPQYEGPGRTRSFALFAPRATRRADFDLDPARIGGEILRQSAPVSRPAPHSDARTVISHLRAHRRAVLLTPEGAFPRPTIIDPAAGALVLPMSEQELELESATLFVPEESDGALQVLIVPGASSRGTDADIDRYQAAHGTPDPISLARVKIESARLGSVVVDGSDIDLKDPFLTESGAIRRALNTDRKALTRACACLDLAPGLREGETVVALSVDPEGIDLRGPLGLARYRFEKAARDRDHLRSLASPLLPFDPNATRV